MGQFTVRNTEPGKSLRILGIISQTLARSKDLKPILIQIASGIQEQHVRKFIKGSNLSRNGIDLT